MRVLITDDEALARMRLRALLEPLQHEVIAEASSGEQALQICEQHSPDVILLDIRMPGMGGIETARHLLKLEQPPAVIFTTAYDQHALEAFETNAVDYLLKPVRQQRLQEALLKAQRLSALQLAELREEGQASSARTRICARSRGNLQLIPVLEVIYFRAEQKYVTMCHQQGEALIEESLKSLESEFGEQFVRIHRNALVARGALEGLEKNREGSVFVRLQGTEERLEVSRRHLPEVRKLLKQTQ